MREAVRAEAVAQRALLAGDEEAARAGMAEAAARWRDSWEDAPPRSFGRLVGMMKAAILAGDAVDSAAHCRGELGDRADSPTSWYALCLAHLVLGDDEAAGAAAAEMAAGGDAFERTADALGALAARDPERYGAALAVIVADFESREEHLTGVAIADTAVMLERLAIERGMTAAPDSPLLPPAG